MMTKRAVGLAGLLAFGLCLGVGLSAEPVLSAEAAVAEPSSPVPAAPAAAISEPQRIVVTATRIPMPEAEVADSVSVFTAEKIEERQYRTVDTVLANVPGVAVNRTGGLGTLTEVRMRGLDSGRTVVMLDGMPMNDPSTPDGGFDFSGLTLDNISQFEVLRGPQSALYGSNASGGVINLSSKKGQGPFGGFLSSEGGSRGAILTRLGSSAGTDRADYSFAGSLLRTDGVSQLAERRGYFEKDGFDQGAFSLRVGGNPTDTLRLDLFANAMKSTVENDTVGGFDMATFDPVFIEDGVETRTERFMIRPQATLTLFDGRWEQTVGFGFLQTERKNRFPVNVFNENNLRNRFMGQTYRLDYQSILRLHETNTILAGVDVDTQSIEYQHRYYDQADGGITPTFKPGGVTTVGVYLEDQINLRDVFFLTGGVRQEQHDDFGGHSTWKASAMYVLPTRTKLKTSAGTGFKAPSLYQLHVGNWGGNPNYPLPNSNLRPETSFGWDAGFEQNLWGERLQFGAAYFQNKVKNKIVAPFGLGAQYRNQDRYQAWGIEAFVQFALTDRLTLSGEYTWLRSENSLSPANLGMQQRRPLNEFSANVDWQFHEKGVVTAGVDYVGRRWDVSDYAPWTVRSPSHSLFRVGASWKFNKHVEVYGRVENLFDKKYEPVESYTGEGIGAFVGATLSF